MYLNCHTYFSLRYGVYSPERLAQEAAQLGLQALALTDINNTSGIFPFIQACREYGILPIAGIEFRDARSHFIGLAHNQAGFYELNAYLSRHTATAEPAAYTAPAFEQVSVIYPMGRKHPANLRDGEYLGVRPQEAGRLLNPRFQPYRHKCVVLQPVTVAGPFEHQVHQILRAVDENTTIAKVNRQQMSGKDAMLMPYDALLKAYELTSSVVQNTERLISQCRDDYDLTGDKNRQCFTKSYKDDQQLLEKLAYEGFPKRYQADDKPAFRRLERELDVINKMGFCKYFLITHDIIRYGQLRGFHHVGRGSGANSIVAYCMGITDVDPIELDLYFERFINEHRTSPPDFDIDFSWDERDAVMDYVFKRYGRDYVCLLATYSTFKGRSIIREFGKAFGLPKEEVDLIVNEPQAAERHHGLAKQVMQYGRYVEDFPNQLSIHAGGMLISEKPLYYYTPLRMMPKGFPISHFDMHTAESIHFHKYDVLSQRGIGHIKMAADLIRENQGISVDVHRVQHFKQDPEVRQKLQQGQTMGCFYIESPAMRGLLSKLRCNSYKQLVAASSIIRPGVAQSGMMKEYIRRHHDPEGFAYLDEVFREHLGETYGVMVYQEDVIKIAHHFGGLGLAESDILRRIMSGKKDKGDRFSSLKARFFENCRQRGYSEELVAEVWRQIASFAGYSFCKAHSASFAVESFQSLYLKTYYPLEFMVAVINNFGGFYRTEVYLHEARMAGAALEAPCVNNSHVLTHIEGSTIYLGFIHLKDLTQETMQTIVRERKQNGPYTSFADFMHRTAIPKEQLNILIRIGALRFTGEPKKALLWQKHHYLATVRAEPAGLPTVAAEPEQQPALPELTDQPYEAAFEEIDLLGFSLTSPFALLQTAFRGEVYARQMLQYEGYRVRMVGYLVTRKHTTTVRNRPMNFGCFLDVEGQFFDTVHFPPQLAAYPFKGVGCYLLLGTITSEFDFPSLEVEKMAKLPMVADPRYA